MSGYFDRIEQQLVRRVEAGAPRRFRSRLPLNFVAPAVSVAVALVVAVVFLSVHGNGSPQSASGGSTVELVYQAFPTPQVPKVTQAALQRTVNIMGERVKQLGVAQPSITTAGGNLIQVDLPDVHDTARAEQEIGATAQLYFYDWEANALLPDGSTVASKLLAHDQNALTISQGSGGPGTGSTTLYDAVKLATEQPASKGGSHIGNEYYLFGKGGTPACAAAAKFYGVVEALTGEHCLLSGPDETTDDLQQGLPSGVTMSKGQLLLVRPGTTVLQAVPASFSNPPKAAAPNTQFYVLKDNVALTGNQITNPRQSTDAGGNPDVEFGFTGNGARAFTNVTAAIAHRGSEVSGAGSSLEQHFAVALDGVLVTVPQIDFTAYPDGIPSDQGGEITGGFTISSARTLATELRLGALPLNLKLISARHLSGRG